MNHYSKAMEELKDGSRHVEGTNACHWIKKSQVPKGKIATYNRSVEEIRPEKAEPNRVRFTAGGNILNYTGENSTEIRSSTKSKIILH